MNGRKLTPLTPACDMCDRYYTKDAFLTKIDEYIDSMEISRADVISARFCYISAWALANFAFASLGVLDSDEFIQIEERIQKSFLQK